MRVFTFHIDADGDYEFYTLRNAKKVAIEIAKKIGKQVLVTCIHKPSYRQDWFTASPDGEWTVNMKGYTADN